MMSQTGEGGKGAVGIYRGIIRTEGVMGLWAGNGANLVRVFPSKGVVFASNDFYKVTLCSAFGVPYVQDGQNVKAPGNISFMAGGMAGMTASALTYPLDLVRGRVTGKGGETRCPLSPHAPLRHCADSVSHLASLERSVLQW